MKTTPLNQRYSCTYEPLTFSGIVGARRSMTEPLVTRRQNDMDTFGEFIPRVENDFDDFTLLVDIVKEEIIR